jgi:hypothetical protein
MSNQKNLAFAGAGIMFVGAFMPIVSMPIVGSLNYFQNGKGDGVIIVLLALATATLAATDRVKHVVWTGLAALIMLGFTFLRFQTKMSEARADMDAELAGNPFRGLAEAAIGSIQLQWGWAVLLVGAAVTTYAGWQARQAEREG